MVWIYIRVSWARRSIIIIITIIITITTIIIPHPARNIC